MRKELYKNEYVAYFLDETKEMIEQIWTNSEGMMSKEEYKSIMLTHLKYVELYKIQKVLVDARELGLTLTPDLQEWIDENITARMNKYVKWISFIVPEELFAKVSIEQTMEEDEGKNIEGVHYFDDEQEARDWLG